MIDPGLQSGEWPDLAGRLEDGRHRLPIRVYFEDTDAGGIVYHASYLRFAERARSDVLRLLGVHHGELVDAATGEEAVFVVRHLAIDYKRPGRLDDLLVVETFCTDIGGASLKIEQDVLRGTEVIARLNVVCVLITRSGKPLRIGALVRDSLQRFLNR